MRSIADSRKSAVVWDRDLLQELFRDPLSDSLHMLILRDMALIADDAGRAPLATLAQRFRNFFAKRQQEGKREEREQVLTSRGALSQHPLEWWQKSISEYARTYMNEFVVRDDEQLAFRPQLWAQWSPGFRKALRNIAETKLIEYFETRVEGGW